MYAPSVNQNENWKQTFSDEVHFFFLTAELYAIYGFDNIADDSDDGKRERWGGGKRGEKGNEEEKFLSIWLAQSNQRSDSVLFKIYEKYGNKAIFF